MAAAARFDPKRDTRDKDLLTRAAGLMGASMAGLVRVAAKEKASGLAGAAGAA